MNSHPIHDTEIFATLAEMVARGRPGVLATVIAAQHSTPRQAGSKMIVHADGAVTGSVGGGAGEARVLAEARLVLADGLCRRVTLDLAGREGICGGGMEVFLEPVLTDRACLVIGAGHVGRALLDVGAPLPFRFTVVDDRPEFLESLRHRTDLTLLAAGPPDLPQQIDLSGFGAVLLASRSHELDQDYLRALLEAEASQEVVLPYLGVVGSRAKAARIRRHLAQDHPRLATGLERVRMPVGLDLGDETPAEMALSILAEILAVLRGVEPLRDEESLPLGYRLRSRRVDQTEPPTLPGDREQP